jgi:hypothetical protein
MAASLPCRVHVRRAKLRFMEVHDCKLNAEVGGAPKLGAQAGSRCS